MLLDAWLSSNATTNATPLCDTAQYMQPSELEIRREVETLRDIRRRSTSQGAIALDPDLPDLSHAHTFPDSQTWNNSSTSDDDSHESDVSDDPAHLFWVPARLHPELAPSEFREFLKEHARDGAAALQRANSTSSDSTSSSALGRRKSMLSRQYKPSENDGIEEERVVPIKRKKSGLYSNPAPQLTINDLQKLEELAEEASMSDDPTKLRSMLRRSISLNVSPSLIDKMDDMPDVDEADAPIIVPPPNQILRRSARTRIRKPNLQGDGGGHRFPSTRRDHKGESVVSQDLSGNERDHDHDEPYSRPQAPTPDLHDEVESHPSPYIDDASILDAYVPNDHPDEDTRSRTRLTSPPAALRSTLQPQELSVSPETPPLHQLTPQRQPSAPVSTVVQPSLAHSPPRDLREVSSMLPAPTPPADVHPFRDSPSARQPQPHKPPSPSPSRKEKEKKGGLFGKWGGKDDKKKSKNDAAREKDGKEREKEKDSGFFGSLFGGKKKHEDSTASAPGLLHGASGPATAAALLGSSKSSKSYVLPTSSQPAGSYARYPIHVERAVYRLSHIKLANPRRPLYEQVLISNLMFWYLGVINKAQNTNPGSNAAANGTGAQGQVQAQAQEEDMQVQQQQLEKERQEREQRERVERERAERERLDRERLDRERLEREHFEREWAEQPRRDNGRKGSLNKGNRSGPDGSPSRRAETPVRGPQYESQHRAMEQEYSYGVPPNQGAASSPSVRVGSPMSASMAGTPGYPHYNSPRMSPQVMSGSLPSPSPPHLMNHAISPGEYYYNSGVDGHVQLGQPNGPYTLPPGAMMPPLPMEQSWLSPSSSVSTSTSPPYPVTAPAPYAYTPPHTAPTPQAYQQLPDRRLSPPPANYLVSQGPNHPSTNAGGARLQGRSLSATAIPPQQPQQNGRLRKKSASARPPPPQRRSSDGGGAYGDEDVPLAVWRQQHRAGTRG